MIKYVVNCRSCPFDIYIGRPSVWGNPFTHLDYGKGIYKVDSVEEAIRQYDLWIRSQPDLIARAKIELKGKILGCWCKPKMCHGDILARIANSE